MTAPEGPRELTEEEERQVRRMFARAEQFTEPACPLCEYGPRLLLALDAARERADRAFRRGEEHHRANCGAYSDRAHALARAEGAEKSLAEARALLRRLIDMGDKPVTTPGCRALVAEILAALAAGEEVQ